MNVYTNQLAFTASASSSASGYPAANLALPQVRIPWRSTSTSSQQITLDFGASVMVAALLYQEPNFLAATVDISTNGSTWTNAISVASVKDAGGRRKGFSAVGIACRYVRITIPAGSTVDGSSYYSIGSVYVWGAGRSVRSLEWGFQPVYNRPQVRTDLPNGEPVTFGLGPTRCVLSGTIKAGPAEDAARLLRDASTSVVGLDMSAPAWPWQVWPMVYKEPTIQTGADNVVVWPTQVTLTEVV